MTANQSSKINIAGSLVIKTLLMLLDNNYTMAELVQKLNEKEEEPIFNSNVISKYINTCRFCGIDITKIHHKYFVTKLQFGLELTSIDLDLLNKMQVIAMDKFSERFLKIFKSFIFRLNKFSNKDIIKVDKKTIQLTYEIFTRAVEEKRRLLLMLKNRTFIECSPIEIVEYKGRKSLKVFYKNKEKHISINSISGIELLGRTFIAEDYLEKEVIYKLTGGLAQRYILKDGERELSRKLPEYITIINKGENKDELLSRLLRYDKYCEIL